MTKKISYLNHIPIDDAGNVTPYDYSILDLPEKSWDDGNELAAYQYNPDGTIRQEQHGPVLKQYQYDQDKNLTMLFVQSGNASWPTTVTSTTSTTTAAPAIVWTNGAGVRALHSMACDHNSTSRRFQAAIN